MFPPDSKRRRRKKRGDINQRYLRRPKVRIRIVDYASRGFDVGACIISRSIQFPPEVEAMIKLKLSLVVEGRRIRNNKSHHQTKNERFDVFQVNFRT